MAPAKWLEESAEDEGPVLKRRPLKGDAEADMTPMIDMTFLLLIFFIVTQATAERSPVELPLAKHGKGVSESQATVIVVAEGESNQPASVHLGDSLEQPLPAALDQQAAAIRQYVEAGLGENRQDVILKAGRGVHHRDVSRVAAAAGEVEGIRIHLAVLEDS